jgi:hypothetical protein
MKRSISLKLLAIAVAGTFAGSLYADTGGLTTGSTTVAAPAPTDSVVPSKYTATFSQWAGSAENAQALLDGLHSGTPVTLSETVLVVAPPGSTGSTGGSTTGTPTVVLTTFSAPTNPMSYRQAYIALALAQKELTVQGVANPTPAQIQTVLDGGTLTLTNGTTTKTVQMPGVLTLRASGMGWGKIAQQVGLKLGPVMASLNRNAASMKTDTRSTTDAEHGGTHTVSHRVYGQGIVSATGASLSPTETSLSSHGAQHAKASNSGAGAASASAGNGGIVTALGGAPGQSALASNNGHGHGVPH